MSLADREWPLICTRHWREMECEREREAAKDEHGKESCFPSFPTRATSTQLPFLLQLDTGSLETYEKKLFEVFEWWAVANRLTKKERRE